MIHIFIKYLSFKITSISRKIYWLYRLSKIGGVSKVQIEFPVICEGKGHVIIGKKSSIKKGSILRCAINSKIVLGGNNRFVGAILEVGVDSQLETGDNCLFEQGSIIRVGNNWKFGKGVAITSNCVISSRERGYNGILIIKDSSFIGNNSIIDITGDLEIGSNVAIGPNTIIYTHDHNYQDKSKPAWKGKLTVDKVLIEDNVWIGSRVIILPGVTIGRGSVIAAGSIITKSVPSYSVVAGVPGKVIKNI